jgi:hypothetical protein
MQYGRILKRAWQVTWHNRALWFFGFVIALFSLSLSDTRRFGGWNLRLNGLELPPWLRVFPHYQAPMPDPSPAMFHTLTQNPLYVGMPGFALATTLALSLLAIVTLIISLAFRYTSQGALIGMVDDVEQRDHTSIKIGFKAGFRNLFKLLLIDIIVGLSLVILGFIILFVVILGILIGVLPWRMLYHPMMGPNASSLGGIWGIFIALGLGVLLVIVILASAGLSTLIRELAYREAVLENRGSFRALGKALRQVGQKLGQLSVMWLLLFSIDLAFGLVTLPLTIIGGIAVTAPFDVLTRPTHPTLAGFLAAIPLLLITALVSLFLNGVFTTFRSTVWTLTYREVAEPLADVV